MASLFFFHFSKREKKRPRRFSSPVSVLRRTPARPCTRACRSAGCRVLAVLFARSLARSTPARFSLAFSFAVSLARSRFCSLARAFASRSNLARVFRSRSRSLVRSLAHTIPQIQKSTRWYTFVALRTKPAQNGCVRRLAGWANMPAFTPNHGRARKATHTHACGTDTSNFSSHDRSPRMMLILSIKSLDSLADFFSSANLASFSAAIARSVYVFAVAKSPIANLDCAM